MVAVHGMDARGNRRDAPIAWGVVVMLHALGACWLLRPKPMAAQQDVALQLVFVQLPPPVVAARSPVPRAAREAASHVRREPATTAAGAASPMTALRVRPTGEHRQTLRLSPPASGDGPSFQRDVLADRGSVQRPSPERFPMREPPSPAAMVRGVAQTLFWPPGYSDDPCSGLPEAVAAFSRGRTERERNLLADAVRERDRYCRR